MLKDIKNILFNEIKDEIEQYEAAKNRIDSINLRIKEIESIMGWNFETSNDITILEEPHKPSLIMEKFSFWDKWILNRKKYLLVEKLNREAQEKYNKEMEEYNKKCDEYNKEHSSLMEEKNLLEKQCRDIEEKGIRDRFEIIKNAKTLKDLGISFEEAIKILEDNGIQLVLDESDRNITNNQSEFDKPEEFILVHKTKYAPSNDQAKSSACSGAKYKYTIDYEGEEFSYEFLTARNTIHFCQNGEVSSHVYGNFDQRKYAVLIPFVNVKDNKNISSFSPEDTFFDGKVDVAGGYILCPKEEVENIQKLNPNSKVIGFEGYSVDGFADAFLSMIGYRREKIGMHSWQNGVDMEKHAKFVKKNSNLKYVSHSGSEEEKRDNFIDKFNKIIGFTESIINSRNNGKRYDIEKLTRLVSKNGIKVIHETGVEKVESTNSWSAIGPSYTDMIAYSGYPNEMYIGDFVEEKGFEYDSDKDVETNNRELLFYILEKRFNIKIPQPIKEVLFDKTEYDGFLKDKQDPKVIHDFIENIQDEETRGFLNEMLENGEIKSVDKVKDVLFVKTIIEEAYRGREMKLEENDDNDEQEL